MTLANELERLANLHHSGRLSDEEFSRAKARQLNEGSGAKPRRHPEGQLGAAINRLERSRSERWLGGVCGGLAQISGLAAWIWRLIFIAFLFCHGIGGVTYLLLWLLVPEESTDTRSLDWQDSKPASSR